MSAQIEQLDLFEELKFDSLKREMRKVKETSENVRKGIFARHNELAKMFLEQQKEIDYLKQLINTK
jgi:hypothetical protein